MYLYVYVIVHVHVHVYAYAWLWYMRTYAISVDSGRGAREDGAGDATHAVQAEGVQGVVDKVPGFTRQDNSKS